MTTYEKAVRFLMVDMVKDMGMRHGAVLTKQDTLDWFRKNYPEIDQKTVECHLTRLSINAPSRLHYHAAGPRPARAQAQEDPGPRSDTRRPRAALCRGGVDSADRVRRGERQIGRAHV